MKDDLIEPEFGPTSLTAPPPNPENLYDNPIFNEAKEKEAEAEAEEVEEVKVDLGLGNMGDVPEERSYGYETAPPLYAGEKEEVVPHLNKYQQF